MEEMRAALKLMGESNEAKASATSRHQDFNAKISMLAKKAVKDKGWKLRDLSNHAGYTPQYWNQLLLGWKAWRMDLLEKLAEALQK